MKLFVKGLLFLIITITCCFAKDRTPSPPFITGDGFRNYADHVYDEDNQVFDPASVKAGEVVFLNADYMNEFFTIFHPFIEHKYILITHNSDADIPSNFSYILEDEKIIAWFGQNVSAVEHKKLIPIPIGLTNRYNPLGDPIHIEKAIQKKYRNKKYLAYLNASLHTNYGVRSKVYQHFSNKNFCFKVEKNIPVDTFLHHISSSKFVISPRGNGLDCHRTWEALYLNAIPVVVSSKMDSVFDELPVLVVDSWEEITEEFLEESYKKIRSKTYKNKKLYLDFWINLIDSYRVNYK